MRVLVLAALLPSLAFGAALPERKDPSRVSPANKKAVQIDGPDFNAILERLDGTEPVDAATVKASGSSTARSLSARFSDVVNVKDYGAIGNNVANDTAAVAAAYAALVARGGGTLYFPAGKYLFNLVVASSAVYVRGEGGGNQATFRGTIFKPWDKTTPVLQFGDGTSQVNYVGFSDISVFGDFSTATSDGIAILGAYHVRGDNFQVESFGRDNITITSTAARYTHSILFSRFASRTAKGNAVKVVNGPSFVSAVGFDQFYLSNTIAGSHALWIEACLVNVSTGWIDSASTTGIMLKENVFPPGLNGDRTFHVDSASHDDILVEIDAPRRFSTFFLGGGMNIDGKIKFLVDNTVLDAHGANSQFQYNRFSKPYVLARLYFGQGGVDGSYDESDSPALNLRGGNDGAPYLELDGGGFRAPKARLTSLAVYVDNAAALAGGLVAGDLYRTAAGVLMVVFAP